MKTILALFLMLLCSTNILAQTSKYFNVKKERYSVELTSKDGKEIEVKEPADNRAIPKSHFELKQDVAPLVKDIFGVLNEEQIKSLKDVEFVIVLGPHLKVVSCIYKVPVGQIIKVLKIEDKLNDLSQKYLFRDMTPFFVANDEALFQKAGWVLGKLDRLYNFDPATFPK